MSQYGIKIYLLNYAEAPILFGSAKFDPIYIYIWMRAAKDYRIKNAKSSLYVPDYAEVLQINKTKLVPFLRSIGNQPCILLIQRRK